MGTTGRGDSGQATPPRWRDRYEARRAEALADLDADALEELAIAAYLIGEDDAAVGAWEEAHTRCLETDDRAEAGRCAFWAAFCLMMQGKMSHAGGWLGRAGGAIGDELDCPARGYLQIPALLRSLDADDPATARALAETARDIAARFDDPDLLAFATLGHGQALIASGDPVAGLARFDEVMLSVEGGDVGPITSGIVYCAVVLECMQLLDLPRASEWTRALDAWCAAQPDLVPYRGQCLVHQSQLQQASGDWETAKATVAAACARLTEPPHPALGLACYQEAELHRLTGDHGAAVDAYGRASRAGHQPMPGLALLELARGEVDGAAAGIDRALAEVEATFARAPLLAAAVEVHRVTGDLERARVAADELQVIAESATAEVLTAIATQADGTVLLAAGDVPAALGRLREAAETWRRLGMPYEAARVSVLRGLGCLGLGDTTSAGLEFDAAREVFTSLGAAPDLERLESLTGAPPRGGTDPLSDRELEVLSLVAAGLTNRKVGAELSISPHTVGRHLENIFVKLGVTGRAAATAYAYEHDLL